MHKTTQRRTKLTVPVLVKEKNNDIHRGRRFKYKKKLVASISTTETKDTKTLTETLVSLSAFVPKDISKIWKEKSRLRDRDYLHRGAPDRSRLYHT